MLCIHVDYLFLTKCIICLKIKFYKAIKHIYNLKLNFNTTTYKFVKINFNIPNYE